MLCIAFHPNNHLQWILLVPPGDCLLHPTIVDFSNGKGLLEESAVDSGKDLNTG